MNGPRMFLLSLALAVNSVRERLPGALQRFWAHQTFIPIVEILLRPGLLHRLMVAESILFWDIPSRLMLTGLVFTKLMNRERWIQFIYATRLPGPGIKFTKQRPHPVLALSPAC